VNGRVCQIYDPWQGGERNKATGRTKRLSHHQRIHEDQSNLIPLDAQAFSWPAAATSKKGWAWIALTGRRPAEIFFSAGFSLPPKKLPFPALIFDGQLKNPPCPRHQLRALPDPGPGRNG
jgi:hypothetical protein